MNLINQVMIHETFGEGRVIQYKDGILTISFDAGEKKFVFPEAFNRSISAKDTALARQINGLLNKIGAYKLRLLLDMPPNKYKEDIIGALLNEVEEGKLRFLLNEFPENYKWIVKSVVLGALRKKVLESVSDADSFYISSAKAVVSMEEYCLIKKDVFSHILDEKGKENISAMHEFYVSCAAEVISIEEYNKIKKPILLDLLCKKVQADVQAADGFYAANARGLVAIEEYNRIKRPILLDLLREKVQADIQSANAFYAAYAKGTVSIDEYNQIKKPCFLKLLRDKMEEDYLEAKQYYKKNLSGIISKREFDSELASFVHRWFTKQRQENNYHGNLPDGDQAAAIAAVNGNVLVTARAGSGKTATLINRAYFMIKHCRISPSKILMLAFNKNAADEMKTRMSSLLGTDTAEAGIILPHVMTFHALAHSLVHPMERILYDDKIGAKMLSRVVQEDIIDKYLEECIKLPWVYDRIRKLMMHYFKDQIDEDRWLSRDDYLYVKRCKQESLRGDNVKSYGEKRIANFLFEHDVSYKYELGFRWNERTYRPDFTVFFEEKKPEKKGVIIEYFGLAGNPDYDKEIEKKREYWKNKPAWTLLEIYPENINLGESGFNHWLEKQLKTFGIKCKRLSEDEIWERVRRRAIDNFTNVMRNFIQRCRKMCISPDELGKRIETYATSDIAERLFLPFARQFYTSYQNRIKETGEDDFDGLVLTAVDMLNAGNTAFSRKTNQGDLSEIKYVAIDEFQDFSELFYRLIMAIKKVSADVHLFCVGDDWQAINGFAGSDLRFFTDFATYFGKYQHLELVNNYRSDKCIVDVGNALMNSLGTPGRVAPRGSKGTGKVRICLMDRFSPTKPEEEKYGRDLISPMVRRIIYDMQKNRKSVSLLDRKNMLSKTISIADEDLVMESNRLSSLERSMKVAFPDVDIVSSTVHGFKGLEEDAVIILDATVNAFPLIHPYWIFTRILGETIEDIVAAERRLFYVALTRAKNDLFIITETGRKSEFLESISSEEGVQEIDWNEYPSDLNNEYLAIEIRNQQWKGIQPTYSIKELLKEDGYNWDSNKYAWLKYIQKDEFCITQIQCESWYEKADNIEITVRDETGMIIERILIDANDATR